VQQSAQALGTGRIKGTLNMMGDERAGLQTGQPLFVEGVDGVAYRLVVATQVLGDLDSRLAARIGQEHLAAAHHKRLGRAHTGFQGAALVRRHRSYKYSFWHGVDYATFRAPYLRLH
jgi:hypothetical protein